mgnify:CR=1 FL=1
MDATVVDDELLNDGVFFDGSSIAGWKAINQSDMLLKPDLTRPIIDPFNSHTTLNIFCDILDAVKKDRFVTLEYVEATPGPRNISAIKTLAGAFGETN